METKLFEIRDEGTTIIAVGVRMRSEDRRLRRMLERVGYAQHHQPLVLLARANGGGKAHYDPCEWGGRTLPTAHRWIEANWDELPNGAVVCVEHILGERATPKTSEIAS